MKGTIAITLNGRASGRQTADWKQAIEDIFHPQRSERFRTPERLLHYYLCEFESTNQVRDLVTRIGGVVVRQADHETSGLCFERDLLGDYGECVLEIPDEGDAWRLHAPANTFQDSYGALSESAQCLVPPRDEHVHVVLLPNYNGPEPDVTCATFHFQLPSEVKTVATPVSLEEAVEILIRGMSPDDRKYVASIPQDDLLGKTYSWGMGIRNGWRLWDRDSPLMQQFPGKQPDDVSRLVIEAAWEKLQERGD